MIQPFEMLQYHVRVITVWPDWDGERAALPNSLTSKFRQIRVQAVSQPNEAAGHLAALFKTLHLSDGSAGAADQRRFAIAAGILERSRVP
ncbi:MAG: hypothetical protein ACK5PW_06200 [Burkholderiales bacterium]